jgi:hypothetical protein
MDTILNAAMRLIVLRVFQNCGLTLLEVGLDDDNIFFPTIPDSYPFPIPYNQKWR